MLLEFLDKPSAAAEHGRVTGAYNLTMCQMAAEDILTDRRTPYCVRGLDLSLSP